MGVIPSHGSGSYSSLRGSGSNKSDDGVLFAAIVVLIAAILFFVVGYSSHYREVVESEIETSIMWEIPEAIKVASIEEKLSRMEFRQGLFGGAGAGVGGLGAVSLRVSTAQELRELVSQDEPIYASLGHPVNIYGVVDTRRISQRFVAFLKNRPGIIVYERMYSSSQEDNVLSASFDKEKITFHIRESETKWIWFGRLRGVDSSDVFGNK